MKENVTRKDYKSLDLFKFIFAFLVMLIHAKPFLDVSEKVNWWISNSFLNLAVPFFFITSGFLLFDKLHCIEETVAKRAAVKKYVMHILKMYIVWTIIWLPLKVLGWYTSGGINGADIIEWLQALFLSGKTGDALWYLLALAVCAVVACLITNNGEKRFSLLLIISAVLYAVGVLISSWYGLFDGDFFIDLYYKVFLTTENGLLNGLIFFAFGAWIATRRPKLSLKSSFLFVVLGFIILLVEVWIVSKLQMNRNGVCKLFTLPAVSLVLFLALLQVDVSFEKSICHKLRDYSTLVFVSHGIIIRLLTMMASILKITLLYSILFMGTALCAMAFAIIIRFLSRDKGIKVFKVLY